MWQGEPRRRNGCPRRRQRFLVRAPRPSGESLASCRTSAHAAQRWPASVREGVGGVGLDPRTDLPVRPCLVLGFGLAQLDVHRAGSHSCPTHRSSRTRNVPVRSSRLPRTSPVAVRGPSRRTTHAGCVFGSAARIGTVRPAPPEGFQCWWLSDCLHRKAEHRAPCLPARVPRSGHRPGPSRQAAESDRCRARHPSRHALEVGQSKTGSTEARSPASAPLSPRSSAPPGDASESAKPRSSTDYSPRTTPSPQSDSHRIWNPNGGAGQADTDPCSRPAQSLVLVRLPSLSRSRCRSLRQAT